MQGQGAAVLEGTDTEVLKCSLLFLHKTSLLPNRSDGFSERGDADKGGLSSFSRAAPTQLGRNLASALPECGCLREEESDSKGTF